MTTIKPIETHYAGCRFRSRLEARWALFFDTLNIRWQYEPQGFTLSGGRNYLPDFLLPDCGTWIEVKGSEANLDRDMLRKAARELPTVKAKAEPGPKLMVIGPIPAPQDDDFDYGWLTIADRDEADGDMCAGFGNYHKNTRPWWTASCPGHATWTEPCLTQEGHGWSRDAYTAARSARFEHGECG